MTFRLAAAARQAALNGWADQFDATGMTLEIRTGDPPTDVDGADTGVLLVTFTGDVPTFGGASDDGSQASVTASFVAATVAAAATGTAGHARIKRSGTINADATVSETGAGGDITLDSVAVTLGQDVTITSFFGRMPTQNP